MVVQIKVHLSRNLLQTVMQCTVRSLQKGAALTDKSCKAQWCRCLEIPDARMKHTHSRCFRLLLKIRRLVRCCF